MNPASKIKVKSHLLEYDVSFYSGLTELCDQFPTDNSLFIIDDNVANRYPQLLSFQNSLTFIAKEENKTLSGLEKVLNFLQSSGANKSTTLVAIGGGIVQEVVSLAAHLYYRGIDVIFVPTTLLAMCDSSIGGKVSLNFNGYKNQLGAYHPPKRVLICPIFLDTLPPQDILSGYGELLKYSLISGNEFYSDLKVYFQQKQLIKEKLIEFVHYSLKIKKHFVERDEFDKNERRILNYGHTFGHAIESSMNFAIPHGVAVAYGIDIINFIALKKGILSQKTYDDVKKIIYSTFTFRYFSQIDPSTLYKNIQFDKKIQNKMLSVILMHKIGKVTIEPLEINEALLQLLKEYVGNEVPVQ